MFKKFKSTNLKKISFQRLLWCASYLSRLSSFFEWIYITAGNLIKIKSYTFVYLLWNINLLSFFSSLFFYVTII